MPLAFNTPSIRSTRSSFAGFVPSCIALMSEGEQQTRSASASTRTRLGLAFNQVSRCWWAQLGSNHRPLACKAQLCRRETSPGVA